MHSALIQTGCNSTLALLEATCARCTPVLLVLGRAEWSGIYAAREHLVCCYLLTVYVDVAHGGDSVVARLEYLVPLRRVYEVVLLEHGV